MSKRNHQEFTQLALAFGTNEIDAAKHILDQERAGRQLPRWLRRAARAIARRASRSDD